mmetsp:Transcript_698/g.1247  ORF Transcript_698/g.1247 Transcript_698/m.1247 type:complete len:251 (-) Transcript_698:60-812(-)
MSSVILDDSGGEQVFVLNFLHYENLTFAPLVLQEMPAGMRKLMPDQRYAALKAKVDNSVMPIYVVAHRLRLAGWCSGGLLLLSLMSYVMLTLVHVYVDCEDLLGFILPALCPFGGVCLHLVFHRYRRHRMARAFQDAKAHLRGVLKWESEKISKYQYRLRSEDSSDAPFDNHASLHVEVKIFLYEDPDWMPPSTCPGTFEQDKVCDWEGGQCSPSPLPDSPVRSTPPSALETSFFDITGRQPSIHRIESL